MLNLILKLNLKLNPHPKKILTLRRRKTNAQNVSCQFGRWEQVFVFLRQIRCICLIRT